ALTSSRFGEGKETSDLESGAVRGDRQAARLKVSGMVRVVGETVPQVHVTNNGIVRSIDDGNGVLTAIGHEHSLSIRRTDDIPRFGACNEGSDNRGTKSAPGRIADVNDGYSAGGGIGDVGILTIRRQGDTLRLVSNSNRCDAGVVVG